MSLELVQASDGPCSIIPIAIGVGDKNNLRYPESRCSWSGSANDSASDPGFPDPISRCPFFGRGGEDDVWSGW